MLKRLEVWIYKILRFFDEPVKEQDKLESTKSKSWASEQMKEETALANKVIATFEKMYSEKNDFFSISTNYETGKEYAVCSLKPGTNTSFSLSFWVESYITDYIKTIIEAKEPAFAKKISFISISCEKVTEHSNNGKPVYEDLFYITLTLEKSETTAVQEL